ncbi:MAG: nitroreductase family protein [Ornithinimicrobium sp.]
MELLDAVRRRRMVRTFEADRAVPDGILTQVLDAATRAPSAGFTQGWDFVVLRSAAERDAFWHATAGEGRQGSPDRWLRGVSSAPCLIVCCSDPQAYHRRYAEPDKVREESHPWPIPYWDVDTGMAAMLMLLTAVDHELGGLFFGVPAPAMGAVKEAFAIPTDRRLVGVVAVGYAAAGDVRSPSLARGRRPLAQVAHAGSFGVPFTDGDIPA